MARKTRRAKGTGSLILKGGVWHARWTENGVRHQESTGVRYGDKQTIKISECDTYTLSSREIAAKRLMELTEHLRLQKRESALALVQHKLQDVRERLAETREALTPKVTVGDLAAMFRKSPRRPDSGKAQLERYCQKIDEFADAVGRATEVKTIDYQAAARYAVEIASKMSPNTYNKTLNALALCWRAVGDEAGAEDNPWTKDKLTRKRLDTHSRTALTPEQVDAIMVAAEDFDDETRLLIVIGRNTGMRLGDACRLRWSDFSPDGTSLHRVKTGKTGAFVTIPVLVELAEFLRPWAHQGETGFVLPEMARRYKKDPNEVVAIVQAVFKAAGIETTHKTEPGKRARPSAGFHSFRHTFVTRAMEAGVPTAIVQAVVGHATRAMTEHYTHVSDQAIVREFGRIQGGVRKTRKAETEELDD